MTKLNEYVQVSISILPSEDQIELELSIQSTGYEIKNLLIESFPNLEPIEILQSDLICKSLGKSLGDYSTLQDLGIDDTQELTCSFAIVPA